VNNKSSKKVTLISEKRLVKSYRYGNNLELTTALGQFEQSIKILPKRRYVIIETGEIRTMNTSNSNRQDNLDSVKRSMRKLRMLISHNFSGEKNELWVTLTYKEHVTDPSTVYQHFKVYIRKLRKDYPKTKYISVIEPQASGSWHLHVLLKNEHYTTLFISNDEMASMWMRGFTSTKRLKKSDHIASYVIAYLSNLEYSQTENNSEKKYVKGARLHLYPKGIRIFRCSRGIKYPIEKTDFKGKILKENNLDKNSTPSFSKRSDHVTHDGRTIYYSTEYFNDLSAKDGD